MNSPLQDAVGAAIRLSGVSKSYRKGAQLVQALRDASLEIGARRMVAIVGPSGSGKSTLLHLIGGMDTPSQGEVVVAGQAVTRLSPQELTRFRRQTTGFVFQSFNLIPNLTALENVALPMEFNGVGKEQRQARAKALLQRFNLGERLGHRPREMSGGEMQRVAIARAVANEPRVVLADEPTGNLDTRSGQIVYELLREIAAERTVVVVTHSEELARLADRVVHIRDGQLTGDGANSAARAPASVA